MNFIDFENLFYMFSKFECIYNHCLYLKSIIIWIILFDISIFFFVDNILFEHSSEAEKKNHIETQYRTRKVHAREII